MANITESTEVTAVAGTDVLYCVQGSNDRKFTASQLATYINDNIVCNSLGASRTPASATAAGTAGEVCWDANYVYVCVAANTWRRAALSSW